MNRETKFRGKTKDDKWVHGDLIRTKHERFIIDISFMPAMSLPVDKFIEVIPSTVGEWIGLEDINSKDLYEGHAVSFTYYNFCELDGQTGTGVIRWDDSEDACFYVENDRQDIPYIKIYNTIDLCITGNETDNPELLP